MTQDLILDWLDSQEKAFKLGLSVSLNQGEKEFFKGMLTFCRDVKTFILTEGRLRETTSSTRTRLSSQG